MRGFLFFYLYFTLSFLSIAHAQLPVQAELEANRLFDVQRVGADTASLSALQKTAYVRISGYAPGAEGRTINCWALADPVSGIGFKADECKIDDSGKFELQALFWQIMPCYLQIDHYSTILYVCPGEAYKIVFMPFDYNISERLNMFFPSNQTPTFVYDMMEPQGPELNKSLWRFAEAYQKYITPQAYESIMIYGDKTAAVALRNYMRKETDRADDTSAYWRSFSENLLPSESLEYLKNYIDYSMALLEEFAGLKTSKALYENYISDKKINYRNTAQMEFLQSYYDSYFETKTPIRAKRLKKMLANTSLESILDSIGVDSTLLNQELREWVFINAMREVLHNDVYPQREMFKLSNELGEKTQFAVHKQVLSNIHKMRVINMGGKGFSGGVLLDEDSVVIRSESLLGEYHYVAFVLTSRELCPQGNVELQQLRSDIMDLPNSNSNSNSSSGTSSDTGLKCIVIVCDDSFDSFKKYAKSQRHLDSIAGIGLSEKKHSKIKYLHLNKDLFWARRLNVYTFPYFIWVNQQGGVRLNAPLPSNGGWKQFLNVIE